MDSPRSSSSDTTIKVKNYYQIAFIEETSSDTTISNETMEFRSPFSPMRRALKRLLEQMEKSSAKPTPKRRNVARNKSVGCRDIKRRIQFWEKYLNSSERTDGTVYEETNSTNPEKYHFAQSQWESSVQDFLRSVQYDDYNDYESEDVQEYNDYEGYSFALNDPETHIILAPPDSMWLDVTSSCSSNCTNENPSKSNISQELACDDYYVHHFK